MTTDLTQRKCEPCEGGVPPLQADAIAELMQAIDSAWSLAEDGKVIERTFSFAGYYLTMSFVNAVAWIANMEDHHPDMVVGYGQCVVRYSTHAIGGLSENDFICAAKIDKLLN